MRILVTLSALALASGLTVPTAACSESPQSPAAAPARSGASAGQSEDGGRPVSNLPYAHGRTFSSLDEYLAHLERLGAIDLPYWRQIAPGLYERVTSRRPRGTPERATRAELMERFGFTR